MMLRIVVAALVSLALVACGVKSNLDLPNGMQTDKREVDPSKPPQPLGQ
jgi:predicted small lipoprotein YifL